jgi:hypothetical protein
MEAFLEGICKPLLIYGAFMAALVSYNITQSDIKSAGKNTVFFAMGAIGLFFLCSTGFETAAWILLAIPPFFFTALLALLVITQIFKTRVNYSDGTSTDIVNTTIRDLFGVKKSEIRVSDIRDFVGKYTPDSCDSSTSSERIIQELLPKVQALQELVSQCDTCA